MNKLIKILKDKKFSDDEKTFKICDVFIEDPNFIHIEYLIYAFDSDLYKLKREHRENPYDEDYIVDDNESVKWNKEEVKRLSDDFIKNKREFANETYLWKGIVNNALIEFISDYFGISRHNSRVLYDYFNSMKDTISEVLYSIQDFNEVLDRLDLSTRRNR